jgi:SAM-dependent methyltransferase
MNIQKIKKYILKDIPDVDIQNIYNPVVINDILIIDGNRRKYYSQHIRLDLLPSFKDQTVLDLGCNVGYLLFQIKKNGANECLGVDRNKFHIKIANFIVEYEKLKGINFVCNDFNRLQFNKIWDNVLFLSVSNYNELLGNIKKVLSFGKRIFIEPTNHKDHYKNKEQIIYEFIPKLRDFGHVKLLGFTDYQNRALIQIEKSVNSDEMIDNDINDFSNLSFKDLVIQIYNTQKKILKK